MNQRQKRKQPGDGTPGCFSAASERGAAGAGIERTKGCRSQQRSFKVSFRVFQTEDRFIFSDTVSSDRTGKEPPDREKKTGKRRKEKQDHEEDESGCHAEHERWLLSLQSVRLVDMGARCNVQPSDICTSQWISFSLEGSLQLLFGMHQTQVIRGEHDRKLRRRLRLPRQNPDGRAER